MFPFIRFVKPDYRVEALAGPSGEWYWRVK
jgi:hypothetical protein